MPPMLLAGILKNNTSFRAELDDEVLILLDIILEPLYGTDSSDVQGPWNQKDLNKYIPNVSTWKPVDLLNTFIGSTVRERIYQVFESFFLKQKFIFWY